MIYIYIYLHVYEMNSSLSN